MSLKLLITFSRINESKKEIQMTIYEIHRWNDETQVYEALPIDTGGSFPLVATTKKDAEKIIKLIIGQMLKLQWYVNTDHLIVVPIEWEG
jgi:hypothetical protein